MLFNFKNNLELQVRLELQSCPESGIIQNRMSEITLFHADDSACSKTGRIKLNEEEYTEKLEALIEAQFFPHMNPLRTLHAQVMNSNGNIESILKSCNFSGFLQISGPEESISSFFRQYISEDNSSFEELQEKSIIQHRRKYHWAYEIEDTDKSGSSGKKSGMLALYYMNGRVLTLEERKRFDQILITEGALNSEFDSRKNGLDYGKFRVRNQLFFPPLLKDSEDTCKIARPNQSAGALIGDGEDSSKHLISYLDKASVSQTQSLAPITTSHRSRVSAAEKSIQTLNTSLLANSLKSSFADKVSSWDDERDLQHSFLRRLLMAVLQREDLTLTGLSPLEAPRPGPSPSPYPSPFSFPSGLALEGAHKKRKYEVVALSPSPVPFSSDSQPRLPAAAWNEQGQQPLAVPASPLVTWGQMIGQPIALDGDGTDSFAPLPTAASSRAAAEKKDEEEAGPRFRMQPPSRREVLAQSLTDASKLHKQKNKGMGTGKGVTVTPSPAMHARLLSSPAPSVVSTFSLNSHRTEDQAAGGGLVGAKRKSLSDLTPAAQALAKRVCSREKGKEKEKVKGVDGRGLRGGLELF